MLRKKECKVTIREVASKSGNTLGCKLVEGEIKLDKNAMIEAQSAMHTCNVQRCIMLFVNSNNHTDYLLSKIDYNESFYQKNIQEKLKNFFENYFAKKVFQKNMSVRN